MAGTAAPPKKVRRPKPPKKTPSTVNVATSHRIKVRCLARMAERPTSPVMVGRELGVEASMVSYHVRVLEKFGLVEQVEETPVRGAVEHFYRTVSLAEVKEEEWATLPVESRRAWIETIFGLVAADAMYSLETDLLTEQTDCEITRTTMRVDEKGWNDLREVYVAAQEKVMEIKVEAETRLAINDELKPKPILSFLSLFDTPPR